MKNNPLAVIEIGTNTLKFLIARVTFHPSRSRFSIKELHSDRVITRLGAGLSRKNVLGMRAMSKSLTAISRFMKSLSQYNAGRCDVIATSALREAGNSKEFLSLVHDSTGLKARTISGREEAKMTAAGMLLDISAPVKALMIDIGGGSTEVILAKNGKPALVHSENLGVVHLADKYMKKDPPSPKDLKEMDREISGSVASFRRRFRKQIDRNTMFMGTAGTVTTLAAIAKGLKKFEHGKVHRSKLTIQRVMSIYSLVSSVRSDERARLIPFEPSRLDIIVPGTLILLRLMEAFGFSRIMVSNYGLREGALVELYRRLVTETER